MEDKIQKQLVELFYFFIEFDSVVRNVLKDCHNHAEAINKLIKRCNNIREADLEGTPLEGYDDLQDKLCAAIHNLISEAIEHIRNKHVDLEDLLRRLHTLNKEVRDSLKETTLDENSALVKGSPTQPPLKKLLEYADDAITFGAQAHAQIENALEILSIKELQTISFADHFLYPVNWKRRVKEIIGFTFFMSDHRR